MEVNENTFGIFTDTKFGLVHSSKEEIMCVSPDDTYYIFFYPDKDLLNIRKSLGRNTEYNMPIIDSTIDRSFKVTSNEELKKLLEDLCK